MGCRAEKQEGSSLVLWPYYGRNSSKVEVLFSSTWLGQKASACGHSTEYWTKNYCSENARIVCWSMLCSHIVYFLVHLGVPVCRPIGGPFAEGKCFVCCKLSGTGSIVSYSWRDWRRINSIQQQQPQLKQQQNEEEVEAEEIVQLSLENVIEFKER